METAMSTVYIVDDDDAVRDSLSLLMKSAGLRARVYRNAEAFLAEFSPEHRGCLLLDIRMPGMDGLEAARHLVDFEEPPAVIFCTAYEEHAIEAFDLQAVGYLLKPVRKEDLATALGKTQRINKAQIAALGKEQPPRRTHISARTRKGIELIPLEEVRYFQADQKYVTVRHGEGEIIIDETLKELEEEFGERFVRVHRNALVAARYIVGLDRLADGHYQIRMRDIEEAVDISRRHVAGVRKYVRNP